MERIRVTRTIVIEGTAEWVEMTLERSHVAPGRPFTVPNGVIVETKREREIIEP